eukprot:CAMPEP_0180687856 /NCGR_PEP_ID=MMETSP1037_2-20121125/73673_1 /TAXON_ID=632150 /ORGANISM="Azadinium spinosum, Strain 3D9" /LENGTH=403 /DNA_ID=CAMNT_0022718663 /DNA_START=1 /DNA_END=1209 /DNA_ORIENTATION=+
MCWTCGMAISTQPLKAGKHNCSMVREAFADYDICSYCYDGKYMSGDGTAAMEIGPSGESIFIVGSWTNWIEYEEMREVGVGTFEAAIRLGDTRMEEFRLVTSTKLELFTIHPVANKASSQIRIEGPDLEGNGKSWLIDGFATDVPDGAVYKVVFRWDANGRKRISWDVCEEMMPNLRVHRSIYHSYFIHGSLTSGVLSELMQSEPGVFSRSFYLPRSGTAEFFMVRDRSIGAQAIYPIKVGGASAVIVGPDDAREERVFHIQGVPGSKVTVQLSIKDGSISVMCTLAGGVQKIWAGSARNYALVGTWNNEEAVMMEPDALNPGVHMGRFRIGKTRMEKFQIWDAGNHAKAMYPEIDSSMPGESVLCGPDKEDNGRQWCVAGPQGIEVEVILSLNEKDKRTMVW